MLQKLALSVHTLEAMLHSVALRLQSSNLSCF